MAKAKIIARRRADANNEVVTIKASMGKIDFEQIVDPGGLFGSYREMAVANGVDPDDPVIASCRGDRDYR